MSFQVPVQVSIRLMYGLVQGKIGMRSTFENSRGCGPKYKTSSQMIFWRDIFPSPPNLLHLLHLDTWSPTFLYAMTNPAANDNTQPAGGLYAQAGHRFRSKATFPWEDSMNGPRSQDSIIELSLQTKVGLNISIFGSNSESLHLRLSRASSISP